MLAATYHALCDLGPYYLRNSFCPCEILQPCEICSQDLQKIRRDAQLWVYGMNEKAFFVMGA